ncbi:GMC family oxidoreductase [Leptospira levettii]|uniref:FAD-dependent oxidoreductase n=1 Tax=Leptospira levettii TaxID=2023178 RepID=UPI001083AE09|nr:GMC family oxidoreductase [Leptospira levettii]MCG6147356.1 GMC family oxidoreductase [Leptospira levettii]TGM69315.1 GMC family oxidoreductase [Leptospira levettii]
MKKSGMYRDYKSYQPGEVIQVDVVVIGSGCGGATMAYELSKRGIKVALLEQGGNYHTGTFDNHELNMAGKVSAERNFHTTSDGGINLVYGNNLGGASVHYWADSYRTPEDRLLLWNRKYGIEYHLPEDLNPYWLDLESDLHVTPATEEYFNPMNRLFRNASQRLGWEGHHVPQARKNCQKSGHCMQGCMFGAKQSQLITHIPSAVRLGTDVYTDLRAERLDIVGNQVKGLVAVVIDRRTLRQTQTKLRFQAKAVCVSAGGFGSSKFLLKNGLKKRLPALGKFLAINPSPMVHALYEEPIVQWRNIPAAYGVEGFRLAKFQNGSYKEGGYMLMPNQLQPGTLAALLPSFGKDHFRYMKQLEYLGGTIGWIDDVDGELGSIDVDFFGKTKVNYPFGKITKQIFSDLTYKQMKLNFEAGAKEVFLAGMKLRKYTKLPKKEEIDALAWRPAEFPMAAPHPAGGCRMGKSIENSVVNSKHQVHGFQNLFVADSSVFPTGVSVDPSFTIMAFSKKASEFITEVI